MHDPTEGGIATALRELASASKCGLLINQNCMTSVMSGPGVAVCMGLGLDPLGLLASGCLLLTVNPEFSDALLQECLRLDVPASAVGLVVEPDKSVRFTSGDPFPSFDRDELARYFDEHN